MTTAVPSKRIRLPYYLTKAFAMQSKSVVEFTWNHPANEQARMRALIRLARFQARGRFLRRPTLARLGERSAVWAHLHRHASMKVVCANPPDHPEMLVWQQSLRPEDLFVDVGANIGSYVVWAGELGAEVIALEPAQDTFALLGQNVALNGYPVELIQAAAGAYCGTTRFTTGKDTVNRVHPEGEIGTKLVTIDSVIGSRTVRGMKVDVEGFEIEVLRGCVQALSDQRVKLIQLEWNASSLKAVGTDRQPVADLLAQYEYQLYRPDSSGRLVPVDDLRFGPDVFARPE
jgi:FkbM family methyltransferase